MRLDQISDLDSKFVRAENKKSVVSYDLRFILFEVFNFKSNIFYSILLIFIIIFTFQMKAMWLSNLLRFLNNLEQYSGEERFIKFSSQKQGEQSLRNFDLSEYR